MSPSAAPPDRCPFGQHRYRVNRLAGVPTASPVRLSSPDPLIRAGKGGGACDPGGLSRAKKQMIHTHHLGLGHSAGENMCLAVAGPSAVCV